MLTPKAEIIVGQFWQPKRARTRTAAVKVVSMAGPGDVRVQRYDNEGKPFGAVCSVKKATLRSEYAHVAPGSINNEGANASTPPTTSVDAREDVLRFWRALQKPQAGTERGTPC